jgi:hypothetical protein
MLQRDWVSSKYAYDQITEKLKAYENDLNTFCHLSGRKLDTVNVVCVKR